MGDMGETSEYNKKSFSTIFFKKLLTTCLRRLLNRLILCWDLSIYYHLNMHLILI